MRKGFESELAKQVSSHKSKTSKAWVLVAISAAILISGAAAFTVAAGDELRTKEYLKLQDGSCTETDCDGDQVCDEVCPDDCVPDCDQICDEECTSDCDGICDVCLNECDECTCDCDAVCEEECVSDCDAICDNI